MNKSKELSINLIASIVAFVINIGISFLLTPYITKNIGVEAYGFVSLGSQFINYASLMTIALNSMASRFITIEIHRESWERANKYFNSVLLSNLIVSTFIFIPSILFVFFLDKFIEIPSTIMLDVKVLFAFLFLNYLISIIVSSFGVSTFATNKIYLKSLRDIESKILKALLLILLFMCLKPAVAFVGFSSIMVTLYLAFFDFYYLKKFLPRIKINKEYFDFKVVIELISSGIWNSFSKLSGILSSGLDLLITNLYIGATAMGSLAVSKTIPTVILSFFGVLGSVFAPQLTINFAKDNIDQMKRELIKAIKIMGVFSSIPMVFLFAYGEIFYSLWVPMENALLLQRLSIIGSLALVFSLPLESLWNIFTIINKVKTVSFFLFINSVLSLMITFGLLTFTNDINMKLFIVAGVSTAFSIVRSLTFLPLYGAKCLELPSRTFYPPIILNTLQFIITLLFALMIKNVFIVKTWLSLILVGVLLSIVSFLFSFTIILNKNDRITLLNIVRKNR